ncbi:MAG: hypothetical protein KAK00_00710 [Nanoarchaeota archaeon]|nr:hypothetical protein [Nanoarchaeota archaeon]
MADIIKEVNENQILLFIVAKNNYSAQLMEIIRSLEGISKKISYVSFNQPYSSMMANLEKNNINAAKFFFIDTLTKSVQSPKDADNCIFVSAPNALTEISVAFSKALNEQQCDSSLFDSLSALLVYEGAHSIIQFAHNAITKSRIANCKAVFIALKEDIDSELIKDLYMFVDKVVEVEE